MGQRPQVGQPAALDGARAVSFAASRFGPWSWLGCLALAGGLLSGCGAGGGSAVTRLSKVADAQVITASGRAVAAHDGMTLHDGDEVRTGASGAAVLATGDRRAYLGAQGSYVIRGRGVGLLNRGAFVVDDRKGPSLNVTAGAVTARVNRSAVRMEHGFAIRVGVLAGRAVTVTGDPAGGPAQLRVPSLYQTIVAGRGLVGTAPLALVDDDAERLVAPDLVGDDVQLSRTAAALDSGAEGRAIVRIATADFGTTATAHRSVSATALPMAIARAATPTTNDRAALAVHYQKATALRTSGGSWGVVARLVGTDATATGRAIDALLAGVPSAGTILAVGPLAPVGPGGGGVTTARPPTSSTNGGGSSTNGGGGGGGSGNGGNPPGSTPTTKPSPSPSPSPGPIQQVVNGVLGLVPPTAKPTAKQSPSSCKVLGLLNC